MPVYYSVITPTQQNSTRYVQINTYSYKWNSSSIEEMSSELKNVFTLNRNFWQSDNHNSQLWLWEPLLTYVIFIFWHSCVNIILFACILPFSDFPSCFVCVCVSCSPSVGYLQPPSSEQYQITQSPSPCNPQQLQQQYSGESWHQGNPTWSLLKKINTIIEKKATSVFTFLLFHYSIFNKSMLKS